MSVEAITWALNRAPVDEPSAAFVLVGLANHADPDGRGAFPSVARLEEYTHLSERTIREQIDILEAAGIIRPCDPEIVAAYIKRADRRPQGWDLDMSLDRSNPEHMARFRAAVEAVKAKRKARRGKNGVQPSHLVERGATAAPRTPRGATVAANGVQPSQERGATVAPEPSYEPSKNPSFPATAAVDERPAPVERAAVPTPSAKDEDASKLAGKVIGDMPEHYRKAPGWVRSRLITKITEALPKFGAEAIAYYAHKFAAEPGFGDYEHLVRFTNTLRRLADDVSAGITCPTCGRCTPCPLHAKEVSGDRAEA